MKMFIANLIRKKHYKLLIIPLIIIFLFQTADFKSIDKSETYFKFIRYFYWIVVSMTIIFLILFCTKKLFIKHMGLLLFSITSMFYLYWLPYGLDITDTGYSFSNSWFSNSESFDLKGTFVFIGLWQHIIGTPSVIWCRLGYVLVISLISLLSFKIIITYYSKKKIYTFLAVLISSLIPATTSSFTLNYNTIPLLLIVISVYFGTKSLFLNKNKYFLLFGVFLSLAIFSRMPYILYLFFPIALFYLAFNLKINLHLKHNIIRTYLGILLGFMIVLIYLLISGTLINYLNSISNSDVFSFVFQGTNEIVGSSTHSIAGLTKIYKRDLWIIFKTSIFFLIILPIPALIKNKGILKYAIIAFFAWTYFHFTHIESKSEWFYSILSINLSIFFLFLIIKKRFNNNTSILIFIAFWIALLSFLGSNNGFSNITTGSIILLLSVSLILLQQIDSNSKTLTLNFNTTYWVLIIGITYFAYKKKDSFNYRDLNKEKLTTFFKSSGLWGIYSSPDRVKVIDELISAADSIGIKDNEYLTVNKNHLFPYLINKKPISLSWTTSFKDFNSRIKTGNFTKYLILSLKNTRDPNWPQTTSKYQDKEKKNVENFKMTINDYYKLVFQNEMFAIHKFDKEKYEWLNSAKNLWPNQNSWVFSKDQGVSAAIPFKFDTEIHGIYRFSVKIKLYKDDDSTNPRITLSANYRDGTSDTKNDFSMNKNGEFKENKLILETNSKKELISISGWILQHSGFKGSFHAEIKDIKLIRRITSSQKNSIINNERKNISF